MSRPSVTRHAVRMLAVAALLAAVPPAALHGALAAAAGTMFEATSFLLAAHLAGRKSLRLLVATVSCGCGGGWPGALSLPATALCWLSFGPWVALARLFAAGLLAARGRWPEHGDADPLAETGTLAETRTLAETGPLDELPAIGSGAALATLAVETLRGLGPAPLPGPAGVAVGLALGGFVGLALPCTSAATAVAGALRTVLPAASIAILLVSGLVPPRLLRPRAAAGAYARPWERPRGDGRFALALVAAACAGLALRGGAGLVSPRLVPIVAAGVPLALLCGLRGGAAVRPSRWAAPLALLAALTLGSPPPGYLATETTLGDLFPGERIVFTGVAHRSGRSTILQRFAITCCRADAAPVALRTQRRLPVTDGSWLEARGEIVAEPSGLAFSVKRWREVAPPADPFIYR